MVHEAILHPVSRLITAKNQPFVVHTSGGATFAIPSNARIEVTQPVRTSFSRGLRKTPPKLYVKLKLDGET